MSASEQWGAWQGPSLEQQLGPYHKAGYRVVLPHEHQAASEAERAAVSEEVIAVLQRVFQGDYPLTGAYAASMAQGLGEGAVHLFTVHDGATNAVTATAAIVEHANDTTGGLHSAELGRAGKLPSMDIPAKNLLRARARWATEQLPGLDFLYSSLRSSQQARVHMPSGQAIQGVWLNGNRGPLMPTQGGYDYRAGGGVEPFTRVALPMRPLAWGEAVANTAIYVPTDNDKDLLVALVQEGTHGVVTPQVIVTNKGDATSATFHELSQPSDKTLAKYMVSDKVQPGPRSLDDAELHAQVTDGISHKVVIEADVATRPDGASVMASLRARGWTFVGWQESEQQYGALCPVMARVNPRRIGELVMPGHHSKQFDPRTQHVFNTMYKDMLSNAGRHPESRLILQ